MRALAPSLVRLLRLAVVVAAGVATLVVSTVALAPAVSDLRDASTSSRVDVQLPALGGESIIYDRYGNPLHSFNREYQVAVSLDQVPTPVVESVLAVEDSSYYRHGPVDAKAVGRALQTNVKAGAAEQGGSTITQQVVKKTFTGDERTLKRKLNEAFLATRLEANYTKDQILERYLNIIYLGNNAYGVQAAAQTYWGKDVGQLDWAEGALLAAMIRDPNGYDPIKHPADALHQRSLALRRLVETGRLSQEQADAAGKEPLPTATRTSVSVQDYFVQAVVDRILERRAPSPEGDALGKTYQQRYDALYRGGLRIYTTYDPKAQQQAIDARQQTVPTIRDDGTFPLPDYIDSKGNRSKQFGTATIVTVEASSGAVRVLLGGPAYNDANQVNIATTPAKQPGSSFKTFVLTTAMEMGYVPADSIDGSGPCVIHPDDPRFVKPAKPAGPRDWTNTPLRNFAGEGGGFASITAQTLGSVNCAFARLGQVVGLRNVMDMARKMGITNCLSWSTSPRGPEANCMDPWLPVMAYGGSFGVSTLDMATAYATLANDGIHNDAYFVDRIEDANGHVVWSHDPEPTRVMRPQTARLVNQVLQANVQGGTGTRAQLGSQPVAGKTGTTDQARNIWFVGYTPDFATAVWIGSGGTAEQPLFGGSATGGQYAAYTWSTFMRAFLGDRPPIPFPAADPTRPGVSLDMGPNDGSPYGNPLGLEAQATPTSPGATDSTGTTVPPTTAPPITSFPIVTTTTAN